MGKAKYADISKITLTDSKLMDLEDLVKTIEVGERLLRKALSYFATLSLFLCKDQSF